MVAFIDTFDRVLNRQVREFTHQGRTFRFPALLADRFEPIEVLACGGFGVLLTARDRRIFQRRVLIKAGLLEPRVLARPNDLALPRAGGKSSAAGARAQNAASRPFPWGQWDPYLDRLV